MIGEGRVYILHRTVYLCFIVFSPCWTHFTDTTHHSTSNGEQQPSKPVIYGIFSNRSYLDTFNTLIHDEYQHLRWAMLVFHILYNGCHMDQVSSILLPTNWSLCAWPIKLYQRRMHNKGSNFIAVLSHPLPRWVKNQRPKCFQIASFHAKSLEALLEILATPKRNFESLITLRYSKFCINIIQECGRADGGL